MSNLGIYQLKYSDKTNNGHYQLPQKNQILDRFLLRYKKNYTYDNNDTEEKVS